MQLNIWTGLLSVRELSLHRAVPARQPSTCGCFLPDNKIFFKVTAATAVRGDDDRLVPLMNITASVWPRGKYTFSLKQHSYFVHSGLAGKTQVCLVNNSQRETGFDVVEMESRFFLWFCSHKANAALHRLSYSDRRISSYMFASQWFLHVLGASCPRFSILRIPPSFFFVHLPFGFVCMCMSKKQHLVKWQTDIDYSKLKQEEKSIQWIICGDINYIYLSFFFFFLIL